MLYLLCPDALPDPDDRPPTPSADASHTGGSALDDGGGQRQKVPWPAWLARARLLGQRTASSLAPDQTPAEDWLAEQFALPADCQAGAYARFADTAPSVDDNFTLTALPAHMHAGMDHLVLQAPDLLNISVDEATSLTDAANEFLKEDGYRLEVIRADCWLMHANRPMALTLHGSRVTSGRNVHAYMPAGPDGRHLRARLNEIQMLWHDHPVNQARDAVGQMRINTLWIEGHAKAFQGSAPFTAVISPLAMTRGLARAAGIDAAAIDTAISKRLMRADETILIELPAPSDVTDRAPIQDSVRQLLRQTGHKTARLVLTNSRSWVELVHAEADHRKFWRRKKVLL